MEVQGRHYRNSSLSSDRSLYTSDTNSLLVEADELSIGPPPIGIPLGPKMAILAATSPEIKAMNLPVTPCFPVELAGVQPYFSTFLSFAENSPSATISPLLPNKETFFPLLAITQEENVQEAEGRLDSAAIRIWLNGNDENLVRSFQDCNIQTRTPPAKVPRLEGAFNCKENEQPNLMMNDGPMLYANGRIPTSTIEQVPAKEVKPRRTMIKRPSFHRRGSYESLPSPDEIESDKTPLARGGTCGHYTFSPTKEENIEEEFPLRPRLRP
jgi:hypothetical protein